MNLANIYAGYKLPSTVEELVKNRLISFRKAMMLSFVEEFKVDNSHIDEYMHQKPKRNENESYEDYKNRMRFSKQLFKFRPYIYKFDSTKILQSA